MKVNKMNTAEKLKTGNELKLVQTGNNPDKDWFFVKNKYHELNRFYGEYKLRLESIFNALQYYNHLSESDKTTLSTEIELLNNKHQELTDCLQHHKNMITELKVKYGK